MQTYFELHNAESKKSLDCGTKVASRASETVKKNESVDEHVQEDCNQR